MTIRQKLVGGYAAMVLIVVGIGVSGLFLNRTIVGDIDFVRAHAYVEVRAADKIRAAAQDLRLRFERVVAQHEHHTFDKRPPAIQASQGEQALAEGFGNLRQLISDARRPSTERADVDQAGAADESAELDALNTLASDLDRVESDARQLSSLAATGVPSELRDDLTARIRSQLTERILAPVDGLQDDAEGEMAEAFSAVEGSSRLASRIEWLATIVSVLVGAFLAVVIGRSILRPIATLHAAAERIGAGDLDTRVTLASRDEMSVLG